MNDLSEAKRLIKESQDTQNTYLKLGNCGITDLNHLPELFECTHLETLILSNDWWDNTNKKRINSENSKNKNTINSLPEGFRNLVNIKTLILNSLSLQNGLDILSDFRKIEYLELNENLISDISFLEKLTGLQELNLNSNNITDISFLEKLTSLKDLNLGYNKIFDISFLENLTSLNSLSLSSNQILDFRFLENLTSLHSLFLSANKITDLSFFEKLSGLKYLFLSYTKITNYSFLEKLTGLDSLYIRSNEITDISFLEKFTDLKTLDISDNQITNIQFLKKLIGLQSLDLSNNQISDIQILLPLIKQGILGLNTYKFGWKGISLHNNPIVNPPINIVEQGTEAILDWFAQIDESGAEPFYESKLMILGQGGAGKTSFANLLLDPNYEVKPGKLDSTLGIVIHNGKEFTHTDSTKPNIKANLWDFGGQDIQKMLHQFFITEDCLYVLVSDKRAENTNFDYWFQIINVLGPKSHVIVLENPKEATGNNEDFPKNKYQRLYPDLTIESIEVNLNKTRDKERALWIKLNQMISERLSEMELVNRMVPRKWGLVRNELNRLKSKKYITLDEYYTLCAQPEICFNSRQADWCLSYFRSLGDLVYFDDRDLCTNIFLDQNWLTTGLYYILSDKQIKVDGGRFTQQQAFSKWQDNGYNKTEKAMLIKLLLKDKFDICYEMPENKDIFITPLLLPPDAPAQKWEYETNLQFRFNYGFIPHGLFSRLIVQLHEIIENEQHWKTGMRLVDTIEGNTVYAEVQQFRDPEENQQVIDIKISGDKNGCKQMLAFIRATIEKLHKDFKNIQVKQVVACNCETCTERMKSGEKPSFYDYEMLWDKVINCSYFVDCKQSKWKQVNIGQIINDVIIENAAIENRDNHLLKQFISNRQKIINRKVNRS